MELKIKARLNIVEELKELIQTIDKIEKEYTCRCTLLEIEIG